MSEILYQSNNNNNNNNQFSLKNYLTIKKCQHFIIGVMSGIFGASLWPILGLHLIWEIYTNTPFGRDINLKYFGKSYDDKFIEETILDNVLFVLGWYVGHYFGSERYAIFD